MATTAGKSLIKSSKTHPQSEKKPNSRGSTPSQKGERRDKRSGPLSHDRRLALLDDLWAAAIRSARGNGREWIADALGRISKDSAVRNLWVDIEDVHPGQSSFVQTLVHLALFESHQPRRTNEQARDETAAVARSTRELAAMIESTGTDISVIRLLRDDLARALWNAINDPELPYQPGNPLADGSAIWTISSSLKLYAGLLEEASARYSNKPPHPNSRLDRSDIAQRNAFVRIVTAMFVENFSRPHLNWVVLFTRAAFDEPNITANDLKNGPLRRARHGAR